MNGGYRGLKGVGGPVRRLGDWEEGDGEVGRVLWEGKLDFSDTFTGTWKTTFGRLLVCFFFEGWLEREMNICSLNQRSRNFISNSSNHRSLADH